MRIDNKVGGGGVYRSIDRCGAVSPVCARQERGAKETRACARARAAGYEALRDRALVDGRGSSDGAGEEAAGPAVLRLVAAGRGSADGVPPDAAAGACDGTGLRLTTMGESCERGLGVALDALLSGDAGHAEAGVGEAALCCAVGDALSRAEDLRPASVGSALSGGDV